MTKPIETYRGARIFFDADEGYWAERSCSQSYGFADTLEELKDEIDHDDEDVDYNNPMDTPSLDDSFHRMEMDV